MIRQLVIGAVAFFSTHALATTWAKTQIPDPIQREAVCNVREPMSSGGYIYQSPSKYDQVFWPFTDQHGIWYCQDSGFIAFVRDFEGITEDERSEISKFLSAFQSTADANNIEHKLTLLERLYAIRETDRAFDNKLWRVLARWHQTLGNFSTANRYRAKAYGDIRRQLRGTIPEAQRLEYLYLAANYARQFGDEAASSRYLAALGRAIDELEDKGLQSLADYLAELAIETPRIVSGGKLDPTSDSSSGS